MSVRAIICMDTNISDDSNGMTGLRRLAASAALIKASLSGEIVNESREIEAPDLMIDQHGEIIALIKDGNGKPVDMFSAWPNKFGRLAFGFACDHFKMLHPALWIQLAEKARGGSVYIQLCSEPFEIDEKIKLSHATPERMTAPALMALCQRMAQTPSWLLTALDELERGAIPIPPIPVSKPSKFR